MTEKGPTLLVLPVSAVPAGKKAKSVAETVAAAEASPQKKVEETASRECR